MMMEAETDMTETRASLEQMQREIEPVTAVLDKLARREHDRSQREKLHRDALLAALSGMQISPLYSAECYVDQAFAIATLVVERMK